MYNSKNTSLHFDTRKSVLIKLLSNIILMFPGLKGPLEASRNRILRPSVCPTVHLSVRNCEEAVVVVWLSSWLGEQGVLGLIPCLSPRISDIGYLLLPSRDMVEIALKRRKSSIQPTNRRP